ncbi:MAG: DedA family protein [Leptospiraceae bacterium]|nr:DedA family protein [Leptospiraceae bacterium]MDW8306837.1 DedA family protein [Leptospiraceae bacterium]
MELFSAFIDFILHIDVHLDYIVAYAGKFSYFILAAIVFAETGLVITPFLPGDSLLFAVGTFAARGAFDLTAIMVVLFVAAVAGDAANYAIGLYFGEKMVRAKKIRLVQRKHLERTHNFFEKHGAKTIILARFVPIVRTFAPFVAGMGKMTYRKFALYNITGAFLWIFLFVPLGFFFGNQPVVKRNFSLVILAIIIISVMPIIVELFLQWRAKLREKRS